jgi:hypothetical protein
MKYLYASLCVIGCGIAIWLFGEAMFWILAHDWSMWTALAIGVGVCIYFLFRAFLETFDTAHLEPPK